MLIYLFAAIIGYFLGSVPFGLVITKLAGLGDIRKIGSGNIGTTNVLRTGRKDLAFLTLVCDVFKAGIAALLAMTFADGETMDIAGLIAGTAGVIGHNFPVWLNFKGGKGVASTIGMMLCTSFTTGFMVAITWISVAVVTRYSSLSALIAIGLSPIYVYVATDKGVYFFFYLFLAVLCWVRHKDNIKKLLKGKESKISFRKAV